MVIFGYNIGVGSLLRRQTDANKKTSILEREIVGKCETSKEH